MYAYLRDLYALGSVSESYIEIAADLGMITEEEKELILGQKKN